MVFQTVEWGVKMNDFKRQVVDEVTKKLRPIKIGIFDIESTGLEAYFDSVLCACIIEPNGKLKTIRLNPRIGDEDKSLVRNIIRELNTYDLLVGWYSSGFDFKFLNTRALIHNLKPPDRNYRRDLCFVSRGNLQLRNNKLATVNQSLFGNSSKTFIYPKARRAAMRGEKWAIDFYVNHCRADVRDTLRTYKKFMPLLGKLKK